MRVLLKISGEALAWEQQWGLDYVMLDEVCEKIKQLVKKWIEVGLVVWAGNFIRGSEIEKINIDRCNGDNMGMLAININAIALSDVLSRKWIHTKILNSFWIDGIADRFNKQKAIKDLQSGKVIIFAGGTGNPYFTTDTAWVLRGLEIEADLMIKATKVDGVYDKDPMKFDEAEFISQATYDEVITKNLRVMDQTAIALAKENSMKLKVVSLYDKDAILHSVLGKNIGTLIS